MSGQFLNPVQQLQAENRQLRALLAAALFRLYPEHKNRGIDVTFLPHELAAVDQWHMHVYTGVGIGTTPPMRVHMARPQVTVTGGVVEDPAPGKTIRGELEGG